MKFAIYILILFFSLSAIAEEELPSVTVLSASSISAPLIELTREYSKNNNVIINLEFSTSLEFVEQIEEGALADVFITPEPNLIKRLKNQGLIDVYSQINLASNKLALVVSADSKIKFKKNATIKDIITEKQKFAIASLALSLGKNSYDILKSTLGKKYDKTPILYVSDPSWLIDIIINKNKIGIVYFSDTIRNNKLKLLKIIEKEDPIIYQAVVVAGQNMNQARNYLDYIKSVETKDIFKKHGFVKK